jgi:8-oxo-dGTP diphosphatase
MKEVIKLGVFGILERDGKVLMGLRNGTDTSFPDCWCHPGGGVEFQEPLDEALRREFVEEVGIKVDVGLNYIRAHEWVSESRHVLLIFKEVFSYDTPIAGDGFSKIGWFTYNEIIALSKEGKTTPLTIVAAQAWHQSRCY